MSEEQILHELNDKQLLAVKAPRQPMLLIAGPGTGKTRTIIARILYEIIHYQIQADQILALTFSNKAAGEIRQRLQEELDTQAEKVKVSTFHSFCLQVLKNNFEKAGLKKYFSVCDTTYQEKLIEQFLAGRHKSQAEKQSKGILLAFSNHQLKGKPLPPFSASVYDYYCEELAKHNFIDYNQILLLTLTLFQNHPDVLSQYQFLVQSVLIDEFQDTDPVQYEIVKLLAKKNQNIFVVADDDQSIYAWRGANPENIRNFMNDFHIEQPLFLETNYRSGQKIISTAQHIVQKTDRIKPDKLVQPGNDIEAKLQALMFDNEEQEINTIIHKIIDWHNNHKISYSQIAVLYPQHSFAGRLSTYLNKKRIPHQQAGGRNMLDHPFMQKLLNYLRLVHDPSNSLILEQLVEKELGYHIYKQIQLFQQINKTSFRKALNEITQRDELGYKVQHKISTFIGNIANLINLKSFFSFERLLKEIIRGSEELNLSELAKKSSALALFKAEHINTLEDTQTNIWLHHSDPQLRFIAIKLLEAIFGKRIYILNHDRIEHIKKNDYAVLLEAMHTTTLPCPYINLFQQKDNKRKGILSVLFRWVQVQLLKTPGKIFHNYVVFDLETTDKNPDQCEVVEIAAIKVENGEIVDRYQSLVKPDGKISKEAEEVHHISEAAVKDAPSISEVWSGFRAFAGDEILLAHNGYAFDFKVIDRLSRSLKLPKIRNTRYDTLILARNLFPGQQNSIDALSARYKLDAGTRHRALDDVIVLHKIFKLLLKRMSDLDSKVNGEELAEFAALGNIVEKKTHASEDRVLINAGLERLLSASSRIRTVFSKEFLIDEDHLRYSIRNTETRPGQNILRSDENRDFYRQLLENSKDFNQLPIDEAIGDYLSFLALINPQDTLGKAEAISLLTFYAAKGLEFKRVFIMGMEDKNMPSFFAYKEDDEDGRTKSQKLEEQRRLLYVGITRAKEEVVFTSVKNRSGRQQKSSPFLQQLKEDIKIRYFNNK